MSRVEKPREVIVQGVNLGAKGNESLGLRARDTHTSAVLTVPRPVMRNGVEVFAREAAEHLASLLLMAQGSGHRAAWDRDTPETYVFRAVDAR